MKFTKMHGAGNDYVYVDCFEESLPEPPEQLARQISDRRFGVGGDGLILICPSEIADVRMRMFNADGSEAEMCGNGIRCVAKYAHDHGIHTHSPMRIETGAGVLEVELQIVDGRAEQVRVNMGQPILEPEQIPTRFQGESVIRAPLDVAGRKFEVTCVSMGNPHCVIFVDELSDDLVLQLGPRIERHEMFPARVNVEFVRVISPSEVQQRTWERGSGETFACGTGASAVCVAGVLCGLTERRIVNHLLGGDLVLEWDAETNQVFKTGPAVEVFSGTWSASQASSCVVS